MDPAAKLVKGDVRGWHVLFLYALTWVSAAVIAGYYGRHFPADVRNGVQQITFNALCGGFMLLITLVVPEMRRSIAALFLSGNRHINGRDLIITLALMLAWGLGASRLLFHLPFILGDPALYGFFGLRDAPSAPAPIQKFLWLAVITILAPFIEEIVFRGYLQNLWMHRFGVWPGIALSSVAFGVAHVQWAPFATVAGVAFALVYLKYRSLIPCMLVHSVYNLSVSGLWNTFIQKPKEHVTEISTWIPEIVVSVLFVSLLAPFWRRFRPQSRISF